MSFTKDLEDYIFSGHSLLQVRTYERDRCIQDIKGLAKNLNRKFYEWCVSGGWKNENHMPEGEASSAVETAFAFVEAVEEPSIFVLRDFNLYLNFDKYNSADIVISSLYNLQDVLSNNGKTIILVGVDSYLPEGLKHSVTTIEFALPDEQAIEKSIDFVIESVQTSTNNEFKFNKSIMPDLIHACRGLTQQEVIDRVSLAIRKHKQLSRPAINTILNEKASIIKASGILEYVEPPIGGLDIVGGYELLKEYIKIDAPCFTKEAQEYGVEYPKGIMFVGVPGAGKTLICTAIASHFGFPLVKMNIGNLMNKYVGESEANMKSAIQTLEVIAPCVLLLDEVEKGFGGAGSDDSGPLRRMFGTFLQWLNDRQSPVYVVATANNVSCLPPEFLRTGRFDSIFGLDLPNEQERKEIIDIHLSIRNRQLNDLLINNLVTKTDGFTGSDIEQVIKLGIKMAFANGDKGEDDAKFVKEAVKQITPLIKIEPEKIQSIREWCKMRAKPSSIQIEKSKDKTRKIEL